MTAELKQDANKNEVKTSLKSKLIDFVNDTVTLDVLTLSGEIRLVAETDVPVEKKGKDALNWDGIFENVAKQLKLSPDETEVSIVAYTHAEWDQDSVNYVAKGADADLVAAHGKTVAAAHEARMNAVKAVADAVEKVFP